MTTSDLHAAVRERYAALRERHPDSRPGWLMGMVRSEHPAEWSRPDWDRACSRVLTELRNEEP